MPPLAGWLPAAGSAGGGHAYLMGGPWMAAMAGAKVRYSEWLKTGERMLAMTASSSG